MTLPNRDLILLAQFFFNNRVCYNLPRKKHFRWLLGNRSFTFLYIRLFFLVRP